MPVLDCENAVQLEEMLSDWTSQAVDSAQLTPLVRALPALPEELLDPSRWPRFEMAAGRGSLANRATTSSIATMPA